MQTLTTTRCFYCGRVIEYATHFTYRHIGGQGEVPFPICDDKNSCIARVDKLQICPKCDGRLFTEDDGCFCVNCGYRR